MQSLCFVLYKIVFKNINIVYLIHSFVDPLQQCFIFAVFICSKFVCRAVAQRTIAFVALTKFFNFPFRDKKNRLLILEMYLFH